MTRLEAIRARLEANDAKTFRPMQAIATADDIRLLLAVAEAAIAAGWSNNDALAALDEETT